MNVDNNQVFVDKEGVSIYPEDSGVAVLLDIIPVLMEKDVWVSHAIRNEIHCKYRVTLHHTEHTLRARIAQS